MPKLGVCGDSYMAATINDSNRSDLIDSEGRHFTELLAKKIEYEYFTLARGACSNTAIRLQITEMVKQKVDLVIVGFTSENRLEIPHIGKNYDINLGVYNLDYQTKHYPDRSTLNPHFAHNVVTETLTNIFYTEASSLQRLLNKYTENHRANLSEKQIIALEFYLDYLYNSEYKKQLDSWVMHSGIKLLQDENINFVVIQNGLWTYPEYKNFVGNRFVTAHSNLNPQGYPVGGTRRWHNTDETQEILANLWYDYLIENKFV